MRGMTKPNALAQALTLSFAPKTLADSGDSGPIRFTAVAYSGGVVPSYGWLGDVAIDLATLQNPDGDALPVLIDHDARIDSIAGRGQIQRHTTADGLTELHLTGELTAATEAGQQIAKLIAEGYPLQMSVGMSANVREVSQALQINGRTLTVAAVFEQPLIREVSFVPVGADPNTLAQQRLAATAAFSKKPETRKEATMSRTAEDQALIDGLNADVARLNQQVTEMQAAAATAAAERRATDLAALFAELGRDLPEGDAAKPYMDMSAASFAAFAADLRAAHKSARKADSTLFTAQGTQRAQGQAPGQQGASALLAAVQNLSAKQTTRV